MDKYITITSKDQLPTDFISNFGENLNLDGEYEIALKTIHHAPAYNLTENENYFILLDLTTEISYKLSVEAEFYENEYDVLAAIYNAMKELFMDDGFDNTDEEGEPLSDELPVPNFNFYFKDTKRVTLSVAPPFTKRFHFICGPTSPLLRYLGYVFPFELGLASIIVEGNVFVNSITPGFIYCSCVENSIIDQQQSRLLAIIPFESKSNYNSYTVENPTYVPLATQSLRDVAFTMCDKDGKTIRLEGPRPGYPQLETIMVLHLRKKL